MRAPSDTSSTGWRPSASTLHTRLRTGFHEHNRLSVRCRDGAVCVRCDFHRCPDSWDDAHNRGLTIRDGVAQQALSCPCDADERPGNTRWRNDLRTAPRSTVTQPDRGPHFGARGHQAVAIGIETSAKIAVHVVGETRHCSIRVDIRQSCTGDPISAGWPVKIDVASKKVTPYGMKLPRESRTTSEPEATSTKTICVRGPPAPPNTAITRPSGDQPGGRADTPPENSETNAPAKRRVVSTRSLLPSALAMTSADEFAAASTRTKAICRPSGDHPIAVKTFSTRRFGVPRETAPSTAPARRPPLFCFISKEIHEAAVWRERGSEKPDSCLGRDDAHVARVATCRIQRLALPSSGWTHATYFPSGEIAE